MCALVWCVVCARVVCGVRSCDVWCALVWCVVCARVVCGVRACACVCCARVCSRVHACGVRACGVCGVRACALMVRVSWWCVGGVGGVSHVCEPRAGKVSVCVCSRCLCVYVKCTCIM